jgi:hypothetical protein
VQKTNHGNSAAVQSLISALARRRYISGLLCNICMDACLFISGLVVLSKSNFFNLFLATNGYFTPLRINKPKSKSNFKALTLDLKVKVFLRSRYTIVQNNFLNPLVLD